MGIGVSLGLVQGSMKFTPIANPDAARAKLAGMPMVKADPAEI